MEWKDIKGYEGYYKCNENGEVLNVKRNNLLKPYRSIGHYAVNLCVNSKRKSFYVHRLVYETFVGEIPEGYVVCHIDCDVANNKLSNLKLYKSIKDRYADGDAKKIVIQHTNKPITYAETIEGEIWVDLIGSNGKYKVSNLGRVKSTKNNRLLSPYVKRNRYHWINLRANKNIIHASLHRLVYESFNGKIKEGNQVDHINANSLDDRLSNLREVTPEENKKNPNSINKMQENRQKTLKEMGGKNGLYILKLDLKGNILEEYKSVIQCARKNNKSVTAIRNWINGTPQKKNLNLGFYYTKK